jgi:hypothetical protein
MEIQKFQNSLIAFDFDNEIVNATDIIKAFPEKRMNDYLRLKQTKEFIDLLENETGNPVTVIKQGGLEQGTWMHRLLAYDFAAWISPQFRLFIYQTFDNVLREKINNQQRQLDYFWDKEDQKDLYRKL